MTDNSGFEHYDLVVLGGGSAGLVAAAFAAAIGARVLIAAERLGGDCTWTGCIPSKALIRAARLAHDGRRAAAIGIGSGVVSVDSAGVMAEVRAVIARVYASETPEALAKRGIDVAIGSARFVDPKTVQVGNRELRADHFVLCTGASPNVPPIPGLERVKYLTYEDIFDMDRVPDTLIVIGAGATGVEIGQALARLGSRVALIDQRPSVLADADPEACAILQRSLESEGIDVRLSCMVDAIGADGAGVLVSAGRSQCRGDTLLLAAGRRPRVADLQLERAGVELNEGAVSIDKDLRTTNPRVYAAGDVTGGHQFTHYAGWQGYVAARNALLPGAQEGLRAHIPWAVFTDPEIAQAGLSEEGARTQLKDVKVHRLDLERVDRAQTEDERDGFLKVVTHAGGKLVGAVVVSRSAGETINELAVAIDRGLTLSDLASTIHAYPTFGFGVQQLAAEAGMEAATSGLKGRALRTLRRLT